MSLKRTILSGSLSGLLSIAATLSLAAALVLYGRQPTPASANILALLDIPAALPGQTTAASLALADASPVRGFNLVLSYTPDRLVAASAADFARNVAYLPPTRLGEHDLNTVRDAAPGRIRVIALAPVSTTGQVDIGLLLMRVASGAPLGATQAVTVSGEVNLAGRGVVAVEPVVAIFRVGEAPPATATPSGGVPTADSTATAAMTRTATASASPSATTTPESGATAAPSVTPGTAGPPSPTPAVSASPTRVDSTPRTPGTLPVGRNYLPYAQRR